MESILSWIRSYRECVEGLGYDLFEMLLLGLGFISWVTAYYFIIKGVRKNQTCEMPMLVAAGNIAWEFYWSFIGDPDLGEPFQWGCRIWFCMDLFINYSVFKYGRKLVTLPILKKYWFQTWAFAWVLWFEIVYFMDREGNDNPLGVVSAIIINVVMSGLYIYQLLNYPELRGKGFSIHAAWLKMIGTGSISVASFFLWSHNEWLLSMCVATFVLDIVYISLYYNYKPEIIETEYSIS